jgi:hypothetical protein
MKKIYLVLILLLPLVLYGQIYEYHTSKGDIIFSDRPPSESDHFAKPVNAPTHVNTFHLPSSNMSNQTQPLPHLSNPPNPIKATVGRSEVRVSAASVVASTSPIDQQTFWNERQIPIKLDFLIAI